MKDIIVEIEGKLYRFVKRAHNNYDVYIYSGHAWKYDNNIEEYFFEQYIHDLDANIYVKKEDEANCTIKIESNLYAI